MEASIDPGAERRLFPFDVDFDAEVASRQRLVIGCTAPRARTAANTGNGSSRSCAPTPPSLRPGSLLLRLPLA
jgi:hypothetical protein